MIDLIDKSKNIGVNTLIDKINEVILKIDQDLKAKSDKISAIETNVVAIDQDLKEKTDKISAIQIDVAAIKAVEPIT
ncbi:MAG: hypothetical protein KKH77_07065 [Candidatus Omnitrophica bacterium]|nr:hypothetical protein [Candidatus Omnitrophota bacterium]MBU1808139.1 hypothetical protein [Candidatus Omnitrophota bacterium]